MKRLLALGFLAATALASRDAHATAAVLFTAGGDARVDRHQITVSLGATGTVTWDAIDVSGTASDIGLVVAVKAGGRVELTEPAFVSSTELATRVVVKPLPAGVTCNSVGGGVDFGDASVSRGGTVSGSGSGSGSGGCSGDDKSSTSANGSAKGEATGGCLTSSQGGCGSCDDNGGDGCNCEPSDHGHPGCSAIHGCSSPADDDDFNPSNSRTDSGTTPTFGPYEETRIRAGDGTATQWLDRHGYVAPAGFLEGLLALEADGYEVHAFRARAPALPAIVKSLRVVTTSPSPTVPLRLVRMSTGADRASTPVTLITLAGSAQSLVGQTMVTIDENKLALVGGSSNYETLVSAALGTPASDAGSSSDAGTASDAGSTDTRWLMETSRPVSATTTTSDGGTDGGASSAKTLGDYFREQCGARSSQPHLVCRDDEPLEAGAQTDAEAPDAEADAGATDAAAPQDAGTTDAGATDAGQVDVGCKDVARERCDDLTLALPSGVNVASRFRGVVGGAASLVGDLSFASDAAALRPGVFTVRPTGEPGLCAPVTDDGKVDVSGSADTSGSASCKTTRTRFRIDLGPLVTVLVVIRVLTAVMRRGRRR